MGLIAKAIVVAGASVAAVKYFGDPKKGAARKQQVSDLISKTGIPNRASGLRALKSS